MLVAGTVGLGLTQWAVPVASAAPAPALSAPVAAAAKAPLVAADVRSAQLTARVRGQRVEALPERTEDSSTWVDLDPTLVRAVDGSVAARVHPEFLKLSGPVPSGSTASLVSVVDPGDPLAAATGTRSRARGLSWGWPDRLPAPVLEGTRATYPEVRPYQHGKRIYVMFFVSKWVGGTGWWSINGYRFSMGAPIWWWY